MFQIGGIMIKDSTHFYETKSELDESNVCHVMRLTECELNW